jgi:hypothetical protein
MVAAKCVWSFISYSLCTEKINKWYAHKAVCITTYVGTKMPEHILLQEHLINNILGLLTLDHQKFHYCTATNGGRRFAHDAEQAEGKYAFVFIFD